MRSGLILGVQSGGEGKLRPQGDRWAGGYNLDMKIFALTMFQSIPSQLCTHLPQQKGQTALDLAKIQGNVECVAILEKEQVKRVNCSV